MYNAVFQVPKPYNEPVKSYAPGSPERESIKNKLRDLSSGKSEIPLFIGGKEIKTGRMGRCIEPHNHSHVLAEFHQAGEEEVKQAIEAALEAKKEWADTPWHERAAIFLRAAELLAGPYRDTMNAATMLNQSKNVFQAEIDSSCELIDFWRFNAYFMEQIYEAQPESSKGIWNLMEYRPLEGFVFAVTPFNFTSIAGNLPTAPAMMGNTVVWKPASTAVFSAYFIMQILKEAGLPGGVINMIPGAGRDVGPIVMNSPNLGGIHFTGSTSVFQDMWKTVGVNIKNYFSYPRIVGETGGKDFIFVHESADPKAAATALVRGAFEYQGQKCSAASRAYIADAVWPEVKEEIGKQLAQIKMGPVQDFRNFVNAVIDEASFDKLASYIDDAKKSESTEVIFGGDCDKSTGYFIQPTVILSKNPSSPTMCEELFGPVLTIYVYPADKYEENLEICSKTSLYALTGSIFARDSRAISAAWKILRESAGNFYVNDKPTGAVVGQQPFGGSRASGTNDKAGSYLNLIRWASPRTIKETFVPPTDFKYPFLEAE
ncbi:MAG: L-glutamate gamma-semialdehyde dehydrogenase [Chloroflexi bacterium]|nr:L-glutamate gamma-semialdehyde dehydrogenase [Chloroflexota bacterium]